MTNNETASQDEATSPIPFGTELQLVDDDDENVSLPNLPDTKDSEQNSTSNTDSGNNSGRYYPLQQRQIQ